MQNLMLISKKNPYKKNINKNMTEICPFSLLLMFFSLFCLWLYMCEFYEAFSTDLKSAEFCNFLYPYWIFSQIFFCLYLLFLLTFMPNSEEQLKKSKSVFYYCVSEFNLQPSTAWETTFCQKSQNHCTLEPIHDRKVNWLMKDKTIHAQAIPKHTCKRLFPAFRWVVELAKQTVKY
jgi:hypothetical protein